MSGPRKPMSVGVKAAWIGAGALIVSGIITASVVFFHKESPTVTQSATNSPRAIQAANGHNSPITTVSQSSNVVLKNNSPNTTQTFSSNTLTGQLNLPVNNSGNLTVNINNPIYTNPPDTELKKWITNLDFRIDQQGTNIELTRSDILNLTALLRKLDERTADVQRLPDGRTSFGGIVGGSSTVYGKDRNDGIASFYRGDYRLALEQSQKGIKDFESSPSNYWDEIVTIVPSSKATSYFYAGLSAARLGSNDLAYEYACKAVSFNSTPDHRILLVSALANLAGQKFNQNQFSNAFDYGWAAVTNYESVADSLTNGFSMTSNDVLLMFSETAASAHRLGKTNEEKIIADSLKLSVSQW
jgi:hypothetical protein